MYVAKVNFHAPNAAELFAESLRDTGFAVITNHPLDMGLVNNTYKEWEQFFARADKENYLFEGESHDGYFPMRISEQAKGNNVLDIKEYYHYYTKTILPDGLTDNTKKLHQVMSSFAETLLAWIEMYLPADITSQLSEPLSHMIVNSPNHLLRILHYPPLQGSEVKGAIRAAEHEDINLITILPAASAPGLQVKDNQGQWHDVPCDPGSIVVNSADMLAECTQGYYKATTHRVCNPIDESGNQSRFSMPLFLHPRDEVILSKRHTRRSYWAERMKEVGVL